MVPWSTTHSKQSTNREVKKDPNRQKKSTQTKHYTRRVIRSRWRESQLNGPLDLREYVGHVAHNIGIWTTKKKSLIMCINNTNIEKKRSFSKLYFMWELNTNKRALTLFGRDPLCDKTYFLTRISLALPQMEYVCETEFMVESPRVCDGKAVEHTIAAHLECALMCVRVTWVIKCT